VTAGIEAPDATLQRLLNLARAHDAAHRLVLALDQLVHRLQDVYCSEIELEDLFGIGILENFRNKLRCALNTFFTGLRDISQDGESWPALLETCHEASFDVRQLLDRAQAALRSPVSDGGKLGAFVADSLESDVSESTCRERLDKSKMVVAEDAKKFEIHRKQADGLLASIYREMDECRQDLVKLLPNGG
jgi:hypothetical protein